MMREKKKGKGIFFFFKERDIKIRTYSRTESRLFLIPVEFFFDRVSLRSFFFAHRQ